MPNKDRPENSSDTRENKEEEEERRYDLADSLISNDAAHSELSTIVISYINIYILPTKSQARQFTVGVLRQQLMNT